MIGTCVSNYCFAQYHALPMICAQICHRWHAIMIFYVTKPGSGRQTKDIGDQLIPLALCKALDIKL